MRSPRQRLISPARRKWHRAFKDQPRALAATQEISERCQVELPLGKPHFPEVELAEGETAIKALRRKAGWGARY